MSDIRFIAWAGYQFTATGDGSVEITIAGVCPPEFTSEDVGELYVTGDNITNKAKVSGKELKPKLVAYPRPTM